MELSTEQFHFSITAYQLTWNYIIPLKIPHNLAQSANLYQTFFQPSKPVKQKNEGILWSKSHVGTKHPSFIVTLSHTLALQ